MLDIGVAEKPYGELFAPHVERYIGLEYPPVADNLDEAAEGGCGVIGVTSSVQIPGRTLLAALQQMQQMQMQQQQQLVILLIQLPEQSGQPLRPQVYGQVFGLQAQLQHKQMELLVTYLSQQIELELTLLT